MSHNKPRRRLAAHTGPNGTTLNLLTAHIRFHLRNPHSYFWKVRHG